MMDIITTIQDNAWLFLTWIAFIGLFVGSFLNVVIHRLPIMMEHESHQFCADFIGEKLPPLEKSHKTFNLIWPLSHCPSCKKNIKPWHNIPVLSYLFLKGKCAYCHTKISLRYPLIEFGCCISSVFIAWYFGFSLQTVAALFFNWSLICLLFIDIDHQLLPDSITLLLLWLGLLASTLHLFVSAHTAIIGAAAGYLVFWSVANLFKLIMQKDGMGYGDFKLLAALGAWLGWHNLPLVVLVSSALGLLATLIWAFLKRKNMTGVPIPFGPYLVVAGWIGLFWGNSITSGYLRLMGI